MAHMDGRASTGPLYRQRRWITFAPGFLCRRPLAVNAGTALGTGRDGNWRTRTWLMGVCPPTDEKTERKNPSVLRQRLTHTPESRNSSWRNGSRQRVA